MATQIVLCARRYIHNGGVKRRDGHGETQNRDGLDGWGPGISYVTAGCG